MLRFVTAGESHGPLLLGIIEGMPAHVRVSTDDIRLSLQRRRLGDGRGARMKIERDEVTIAAGVRHGETLGSPIAIQIANSEWPQWREVMAADEVVDSERLNNLARGEALTRPRPGHADLAGMQKYDFAEARPILERASARETAARVATGEIAKRFLDQVLGIGVLSHVVSIGGASTSSSVQPTMDDLSAIDADPVRCFDAEASMLMQEEISAAQRDGDTLGGIVEVLVHNCPPGLGTHVASSDRLDARLAGAMMGIQAIKAVEIGDGFDLARIPGSQAHDEMGMEGDVIRRFSDRAGGVEGGMSNGSVIRIRLAMKPIATVPRALRTVDVATKQNAQAHHQRSDVCAVPAAGVIAEAVAAQIIASAVVEKFGGDTLDDVRTSVGAYLQRLRRAGVEVRG